MDLRKAYVYNVIKYLKCHPNVTEFDTKGIPPEIDSGFYNLINKLNYTTKLLLNSNANLRIRFNSKHLKFIIEAKFDNVITIIIIPYSGSPFLRCVKINDKTKYYYKVITSFDTISEAINNFHQSSPKITKNRLLYEYELGTIKRHLLRKNHIYIKIEIIKTHVKQQTIDHRTIHSYYRLSATVESRDKNGTELLGQIFSTLAKLTKEDWKKQVISEDALAILLDIWDKWHLNDLTPYCIHQIDELNDELLTNVCPITGYKYGHNWLVEEIPSEVILTLENLSKYNQKEVK